MSNPTDLKLSKVAYGAFFLGDAVLLGMAIFFYHAPLGLWEAILIVGCGLLGALFAVAPFIMEYRAAVKLMETGALISTLEQIKDIELVARQIGMATSQWQGVQEQSTRTVKMAQEIAGHMAVEIANFSEFMRKANDSEKANLRLELEKQNRSETEFIQIIVRILDHTFALHQAAVRSAQPSLIEQLGQFQGACRDVARRIGLTPFAPSPNDPFDSNVHQSADSQAMPVINAKVRDTVATGYTYQGRLIRPALVALQNQSGAAEKSSETTTAATTPAKQASAPAHAAAADAEKSEPSVADSEVKPAEKNRKPNAVTEPNLL